MNKLSFKAKLLGIVFVLSIISLSIFTTLTTLSYRSVNNSKKEAVRSASENVLDKIDRNLFERYGDVQAFALSEPARSGDPARLTAFMKDMMGAYSPIYQLMMVVNLKGNVIAVNPVDKDGKPIDASSVMRKNYSEEAWFKAAVADEIKAGTARVEELHVDEDVRAIYKGTGKVMNFTAAIRHPESGKILGVWTNRMSWGDVVETIVNEQIAALKNPHMPIILPYIMNKEGVYLVHPNGDESVLKSKLADFASRQDRLKLGSFDGEGITDSAAFKGDVFQGTALSKGYSIYPSLGWVAMLEIPTADPLKTTFNYVAVVAIALILISGGMAYLVIRGLSTNLNSVIHHLSKESSDLRSASGKLNEQATELSQASMSQAASLQETASSVEEISAMVTKSSESADRSIKVANTSQQSATRGKTVVERMIASIEEINNSNSSVTDQFEKSNQELTNIIKVISEIGNRTKVINDIVFQTKLLSFNASVEAARAGEHGKGFAVVAEEVGNLAQMSGNAAKEISDMLNESISTVENIVQETKSKVESLIGDSKSKIESGISIAKECGVVLEEIVTNENEINHMINEISIAGKEQATGVSEINKAIAQLDEVTHHNANRARETSDHANRISENANRVQDEVDTLEALLMGNGKHSALPAPRPVAEVASAASNPGEGKLSLTTVLTSAPAKVIPMKRPTESVSSTLKTAVGSDVVLPSADDKRFEEI